jgi:amino acid adenylation domain-containing protein
MEPAVEIKIPTEVQTAQLASGQVTRQPSRGNTAPLSFGQQQVWLHAQLVPEIPVYNEPVTIRRHGSLDVAALERSLTEIVRRHEAWRTTFTLADGEPVQIIQPATGVSLPVVDLSELPETQKEASARRLAHEDALRPFDLSAGPLLRALLVKLSNHDHRIFLTLHHIIFDGYSIYRVFLPELAALYAAFSQGQDCALPDPSIQYSDFALWERDHWSRNGHLPAQLAYWRKQLGGNLPVLPLPSDYPRPAVQSFRGATQPVEFPRDLADALKLLSRREGATLFMTLLTAFAVLLHRYSSSEDVVIGTVSSGRKRTEFERLLGYFLNPVVLRNDLSGDPTLRELLRRTRNLTLDALSNDDAPFTQVVNALHPNRSLSLNPLFQVLLTLEPPLPETQDGWTAALTQSEVDTGFIKFDLCLELDDRPSGIVGRFKYSTDLFSADTVSRMAGHLTALLQGIAANPDQRISELPILSAGERQQICVEWNNTSADFPADLCLHQLVMAQAERTPEAVAVFDGNKHFTYEELDRKSNQLGAYLRKRGIVPETPVGLYLEPSCEMVLGILGVLKAGGVCVPLDPSYPPDRLQHVVDDAQLRVLLAMQQRPPLPRGPVEVCYLDSGWEQIGKESGESVPSECRPENLAYLIYTSGSTGKPKGVQITHQNLVHSTHARSLYYGAEAGRFLLLSSFAFDSSFVGIFGTLCRGGVLVLTPGPLQESLTGLASFIAQHRISELLCVPPLYNLLLEQAKPGQLDSLRVAIVAGESCPAELVERHHKLLPHTTLFNEYGPTEAAVWSTVYKCEPRRPERSVPIGRPIPNVQVYVVDSHLNPLPIGVPGELCIGGPGVVRGYWNRPEETAARFVPDPFSTQPGARLYKSGDLVRYRADGNLDLLGRLDHQIKIRGFRVELEEIEAVVAESNDVRQVVVALRAEGMGEPKLVAYVVAVDPVGFNPETLRRSLSSKLPEAMIPTAFVVLDALPLTPNGKVDRQALPAASEPAPAVRFAPSNSALESKLTEIWESVLDKHGIGPTDNFFDLGGHSLLVAKLLLRIEQRLGKKLSLANVFQAPTVRQLAALLEGETQSKHHPAIVPIQPHGSKPILFWVRGGPLFLSLANRLGPDQPFLGLHLPVADAARLPVPYRFEDIASALVTRLREVQPEGPYHLAGLCVNAVIAYEMARRLELQGQKVALLVMVDGQNPAYYQDFSEQSRTEVVTKKLKFHLRKLRQGGLLGLPGFIAGRTIGIGLRLSVGRWRLYHKLGWRVSEKHLQADLDTIVHPASYLYRPEPYPGHIVFIQSTDWPPCRYFDFYESWNGMVSGGMEVHKIAGGHQAMFYEENLDALASKLQICLAAAIASSRKNELSSRHVEVVKPAPPKIREAAFEDYPQISVLESRYGLSPKSYEEWKDLWLGNPLYHKLPGWPIGWVCENADGEIVGSVANIPLAYGFEGRPLIAATSRSLVVDSAYRSHSLWLLSKFFGQKDVELFLNTTVNAKAAKLQEAFRALRVPVGAWDRSAFWVTNYRAFTASLMARKGMAGVTGLSYPLSAGLFVRDTFAGRALWGRHNGVRPQFCTQFDERFDVFWERMRTQRARQLLATRSRRVLDWHFRHSLASNRAWLLTVTKGDELSAYAILCRQDNPFYELQRMRLVDFQALPGQMELLRPTLAQALQRCHDEGVHMLEAMAFSAEKQRVIDSTAPHYRELGAWRYFYKAKDERLAQRLRDPEVWDPCCFDGDASL